MNFTDEMIEKAKTAASPDELLAMAREHGVDLTPDQAKTYFDYLSAISDDALDGVSGGVPPRAAVRAMPGMPSEGALSDDELSNVSGGGCYKNGQLVVTLYTRACENGYRCKSCRKDYRELSSFDYEGYATKGLYTIHKCSAKGYEITNWCDSCYYMRRSKGLYLCTNPIKAKN